MRMIYFTNHLILRIQQKSSISSKITVHHIIFTVQVKRKSTKKKDSNCRQRQVIYENVLYKIHDSPHAYSKLHTYCNFVLVWKAIITIHSPYELKRMLNCSLHKKLQQKQFCKLNCNRCVVNNLFVFFFLISTWETVACFSLNQVINSVWEKWKEKLRIHIVPKL